MGLKGIKALEEWCRRAVEVRKLYLISSQVDDSIKQTSMLGTALNAK